MTLASSVERALEASQRWLLDQDAAEATVAAHEAGVARSDKGARRWIRRILRDQDRDGSWGGDLLRTVESVLLVDELRHAAGIIEQDPGVGLAMDWIRSCRGRPGSWVDGCDPERHSLGLCHHFAGGFFAPAPPELLLEDVRLRSGARLTDDGEARLVISATALRCLGGFADPSRDDRLHLDALRRLTRAWDRRGPAGLTTTALLAALHTLVVAGGEEDRELVERGLHRVGGKQRGDGSWVDTDPFLALEVVGAAVDAGVAAGPSGRALWYGARLLIASQQADGSWGQDHGARRGLIAWRTLRRVDPAHAA